MNFLKTTFNEFLEDRCTTFAASLAYYTVFALPPLLFLLVTVVTFGMSAMYEQEAAKEKARQLVKNQAAQMIGNPDASQEIDRILQNIEAQGGTWWKTLLSIVGIVIGATGVVAAIQDSLNYVWNVRPDPDEGGVWAFLSKRLLSLAMILGLGFLLLISLVVSALATSLGGQIEQLIGISGAAASVVDYAMQLLVPLVVFAAIYRYMPDVRMHWKDVLVGALVTTILFMIGRFALQFYLSKSNPGEQLGSAAASLAVILVWVYYSAAIFLFGAEFTQVFARRYGRGMEPEAGAVRVVEHLERTPPE